MIDSSYKLYNIDEQMIGFTIGDHGINDEFIKVYIPILMPYINGSDKEQTLYVGTNRLYLNDDSAIKIKSVVNLRDYILVKILPSNKDIIWKSFETDGNNTIPAKTKVLIHCINKNLNQMYITSIL